MLIETRKGLSVIVTVSSEKLSGFKEILIRGFI